VIAINVIAIMKKKIDFTSAKSLSVKGFVIFSTGYYYFNYFFPLSQQVQ